MSRITKALSAIVVIALLLVAGYMVAEATSYTKTTSSVTVNGIAFQRFTHTMLTRTDTAYCNLIIGKRVTNPAFPLMLYVYTQNKVDSALSIGIRYQVSSDGSNWSTTTIGTDSTTWAPAAGDTIGKTFKLSLVKVQEVYAADGLVHVQGNHPYQRIMVVGITAKTNIGCKWKIDAVFQ